MKKLLALLALSVGLLAAASFAGPAGGVHAGGPASYDDFNHALEIKVPSSEFANTSDASQSANDPALSCNSNNNNYGNSFWYVYRPVLDQDVDINTFGSSYDTLLAVLTGTKGALTEQACNDEFQIGVNHQSAVKLAMTGGVTYYILVASFGGNNKGQSLELNISAQDQLFFDNVNLKCYQAKIAKRSARFRPVQLNTADQNFHFEADTSVTGLALYCDPGHFKFLEEPTRKGTGSIDREDLKVTCYTARDNQVNSGQHPTPASNASVFAQNGAFGDQKLTLGRLEMVCVPALKTSGQFPNLSPYEHQILRCYSARPVKGSARHPAVRGAAADQFGEKSITLLRPVSYCTLGDKAAEINCNATILCPGGDEEPNEREVAIVCYAVRQPSFHPFDIPVIDQFIDQQFVDPIVTIKRADRVCLSSVKKPPFAENDDFKNATTVTTINPINTCAATFDICPFDDHVVTMNATRARNDPPMIHCASVTDHVDYGHSVWYTFTPGNTLETDINFSTAESSYDTVLAIYTGSKGGLTQVACNDDADQNTETSAIEFNAQVGQKYYIMVGSKDRTPGGKLKFHAFDTCVNGVIAGPCD